MGRAAAEPQSRIVNLVETGWLPLVQRHERHGGDAVTSTAHLFANRFGLDRGAPPGGPAHGMIRRAAR